MLSISNRCMEVKKFENYECTYVARPFIVKILRILYFTIVELCFLPLLFFEIQEILIKYKLINLDLRR